MCICWIVYITKSLRKEAPQTTSFTQPKRNNKLYSFLPLSLHKHVGTRFGERGPARQLRDTSMHVLVSYNTQNEKRRPTPDRKARRQAALVLLSVGWFRFGLLCFALQYMRENRTWYSKQQNRPAKRVDNGIVDILHSAQNMKFDSSIVSI